MRFSHAISLAALGLMLSACVTPQSSTPTSDPQPFRLQIAHINDTHSAFDPVAASFSADGTEVYTDFGGHPRLFSKVNAIREQAETNNESLLFLHGGDAWQGSAYFKVNEGRMNADILSRMGVDAMALGNHEFDLTNALLNDFLSTLSFPVLAANVDPSLDADLNEQNNLLPYVIFAFDGASNQRLRPDAELPTDKPLVAVFGLALDDMPNIAPNTGELRFLDMVESAQHTVDTLHARGVNNIVALTHIGNAVDLDIAARVNGIDVIVGGHSHSLLGDFSNLGLGTNNQYAQRVTNPDGLGQTCVVQSGDYAQAVGHLYVEFSAAGEVQSCRGGNTLLSDDRLYPSAARKQPFATSSHEHLLSYIERQSNIGVYAEDPGLRQHIDTQYRPAVEEAYGAVISTVARTLRHVRRPGDSASDQHGSEIASWVAEAQYRWAASPEVAAVTGLKADFALVGAGGIRTHINEGELREGDITLELLPFANFLSLVPLRGSVVREVIESTVRETLPNGSHAGKFPYGGGLRYLFLKTAAGEAGELSYIEVNHGTLHEPHWRPLENNELYNVVMNSYNATGNDGWTAVFEAQRESSDRIDLALVNGALTAFPVSHVEAMDGGRFQVHYQAEPLNCEIAAVQCNTDARAVVEYIRQYQSVLTPFPYPVVTLERLE